MLAFSFYYTLYVNIAIQRDLIDMSAYVLLYCEEKTITNLFLTRKFR